MLPDLLSFVSACLLCKTVFHHTSQGILVVRTHGRPATQFTDAAEEKQRAVWQRGKDSTTRGAPSSGPAGGARSSKRPCGTTRTSGLSPSIRRTSTGTGRAAGRQTAPRWRLVWTPPPRASGQRASSGPTRLPPSGAVALPRTILPSRSAMGWVVVAVLAVWDSLRVEENRRGEGNGFDTTPKQSWQHGAPSREMAAARRMLFVWGPSICCTERGQIVSCSALTYPFVRVMCK